MERDLLDGNPKDQGLCSHFGDHRKASLNQDKKDTEMSSEITTMYIIEVCHCIARRKKG
jgi:hypothetical protein